MSSDRTLAGKWVDSGDLYLDIWELFYEVSVSDLFVTSSAERAGLCCPMTSLIKLCQSGAQTCVLPLLYDRNINPVTLKLKGDQDIVKYTLTLKMKLA